MPPSILSRAIAGQPVRAAIFAVGPLAILRGAGFNERQYLAETLSGLLHVKVSQQDAEFFLRAARAGNQRAMIRGLAKYAAAWKALDATARANLKAHLSLTQEGASAAFGQYGAAGSLVAALGSMLPSQGYCTTVNLTSAPTGTTSKALDAGSTLSSYRPGRQLDIEPQQHRPIQCLIRIHPRRTERSTRRLYAVVQRRQRYRSL